MQLVKKRICPKMAETGVAKMESEEITIFLTDNYHANKYIFKKIFPKIRIY